MKMMFICGALEWGKDGVGDYTRQLADSCSRHGHDCTIVALNDPFVSHPCEPDCGWEAAVKCFRFSGRMPWQKRFETAKEIINNIAPDWISLQFVPYGFQSKGVVCGVRHNLCEMVVGRKTHLMCHELWLGECVGASFHQRSLGALQRICALKLIRGLQPTVIHTSNFAYRESLRRNGVEARVLPLFGNIPVIDAPPWSGLLKEFFPENTLARGDVWVAVFFGTLYPDWEPEPLFSILQRAANGRRVFLVAVGRLGAKGETKWARLVERYSDNFQFVHLGEQPPAPLSALFQTADFGIAASPWQLIGKSGAAAAMLDHGLPVIVSRDDWHLRGGEPENGYVDPLLHRCDDSLEGKLVVGLKKRSPRDRSVEVAERFLRDLDSSASRATPR